MGLSEWEALYNPDFNYTEFGIIINAAIRRSIIWQYDLKQNEWQKRK